MIMYMEANEGKLRRHEGIPYEKVMAFDPRDLLPSDVALEMEWRTDFINKLLLCNLGKRVIQSDLDEDTLKQIPEYYENLIVEDCLRDILLLNMPKSLSKADKEK